MYVNDSVGSVIYAYDFDLESGGMSNPRVLVDLWGTVAEPDGMVLE